MIRILIADDQRLMRDGLVTLLRLEQDIEVLGTAENGEQAVQFLQHSPVDVVLMDIRMPVKNGIDATREIAAEWPSVKVLMLTTFEEQQDVVSALSAGAVGYLLKDMPAEEIASAIRVAFGGGAVLPPSVAKTFLSAVHHSPERVTPVAASSPLETAPHAGSTPVHPALSSLTEREVDVLHCLARGMSNREISEALFVTEGTVKNHVSSLIGKLELRDRTQVALFAVRNGFGTGSK